MANGRRTNGGPSATQQKMAEMRERARERRRKMLGMMQHPTTAGQGTFGDVAVGGAQPDARERMQNLIEKARAASGVAVNPGVAAYRDDLQAEFDERMDDAREQYGPGPFNVIKQLTPAEKAEAMARVQRRQEMLRNGGR